jgi:hypothetical protein
MNICVENHILYNCKFDFKFSKNVITKASKVLLEIKLVQKTYFEN